MAEKAQTVWGCSTSGTRKWMLCLQTIHCPRTFFKVEFRSNCTDEGTEVLPKANATAKSIWQFT